tara:strand:- start:218 stop:382 length:165 start_codon:yes stop_codon:yes gene_type:complete
MEVNGRILGPYKDLSGVVLVEADLSGADLSAAELAGTDIDYADLSGAVLPEEYA